MKVCDFPGCGAEALVPYVCEKTVCKRHWDELCKAHDQGMSEENELLQQIGLARSFDGTVRCKPKSS